MDNLMQFSISMWKMDCFKHICYTDILQ